MSRRLAALLLTLFAFCAVVAPTRAQESAPATADETTARETRSIQPDAETPTQRATRLKAEGQALRKEAEATFVATEPVCYKKFLVNRCIDNAKKQRLDTILRARELEAEARRLELAERKRAVAEAGRADATTAPLAPATPSSTSEATVQPTPEAEQLRAQREALRQKAETDAQAARAAKDAARAQERAQTDAEAARRAEQAKGDRERYEQRLRKYEEDKAQENAPKPAKAKRPTLAPAPAATPAPAPAPAAD
jgi:hypothetical protein